MNRLFLLKTLFLSVIITFFCSSLAAQDQWQQVETANQSQERHENAFVKSGDKFYLVGGRGLKSIDIYDPETSTWTEGAPTPIEIHHFQAVSYQGLIYVIGGLTGGWPSETPPSHIYIYNPLKDKWMVGPEIPPHRQRGAAGVTVYNDKIYVVCGIVNGHSSGWVPWMDEFDPATNSWKELPDAPRARDHFQAAVADDKLVAAGGRRSGYQGQGFEATVAETDIYDFRTGTWSTLPSPDGDIPTERAGTAAIAAGGEVIIIGGESGSQNAGHNEAEALNPSTGVWRSLPSLQQGRHGTQAILSEGRLFIEAGSGNRGGGPELSSPEMLELPGADNSDDESIIAGTLNLSAGEHDFGSVSSGDTLKETFEISNTGGNQGIPISYIIATGSNDFAVNFPYSLPYVLGPGKTVSFEVHFLPENDEPSEASLLIKADDGGDGQPYEIRLRGN
ncbi:MAG: kelch repeat-containing protein [Balneolaceae bacterium]